MYDAKKIDFYHRIKLPNGEITPGSCFHGPDDADYASYRFGMPLDLTSKTVLDIGAWDGYFSFEAEKRGAKVTAIDPYQNGLRGNSDGFWFAKEALNSKVEFKNTDLLNYQKEFWSGKPFDVTLFYGVLYHSENPVGLLRALSDMTKEFTLIETTIWDTDQQAIDVRPGHEGDNTNLFYPSLSALTALLKLVGFRTVELVWTDKIRATVKAIK